MQNPHATEINTILDRLAFCYCTLKHENSPALRYYLTFTSNFFISMQILLIEKSQKCGCGSQGKVEKFLYKNFINEI